MLDAMRAPSYARAMGATIYIGKNLRLEPPGDDGGNLGLVGADLDSENMSWSSISKLQELAEQQLGIPPETWPFYEDVELEENLPMEDVLAKCSELRAVLGRYTLDELPYNYWLQRLARALREGFDFCAKAW
ncbi:hypothetical protein QHF83_03035 [Polyangium sp. 15x6]|nr:hypothetical protein [Polyangium sp. 15x6]